MITLGIINPRDVTALSHQHCKFNGFSGYPIHTKTDDNAYRPIVFLNDSNNGGYTEYVCKPCITQFLTELSDVAEVFWTSNIKIKALDIWPESIKNIKPTGKYFHSHVACISTAANRSFCTVCTAPIKGGHKLYSSTNQGVAITMATFCGNCWALSPLPPFTTDETRSITSSIIQMPEVPQAHVHYENLGEV